MDELVSFLAEYCWIYDFKLTQFLQDRVWENIPSEWCDTLLNLSVHELNGLPYGELQTNWPTSFKEFISKCLQYSLPREQSLDGVISLDQHTEHPSDKVTPLDPSEIDAETRRGMSQKKLHEVCHMTSLIHHVTKTAGNNAIVDVGSGLGYLGQVLHAKFDHNVLGLEGKQCHTSGAEKRAVRNSHCPRLQNVTCELHQDQASMTEFLSLFQQWFSQLPPGGADCCHTQTDSMLYQPQNMKGRGIFGKTEPNVGDSDGGIGLTRDDAHLNTNKDKNNGVTLTGSKPCLLSYNEGLNETKPETLIACDENTNLAYVCSHGSCDSLNKGCSRSSCCNSIDKECSQSSCDSLNKGCSQSSCCDSIDKECSQGSCCDSIDKECSQSSCCDSLDKQCSQSSFCDSIDKGCSQSSFCDSLDKECSQSSCCDSLDKEFAQISFCDSIDKEFSQSSIYDSIDKECSQSSICDSIDKECSQSSFCDCIDKEGVFESEIPIETSKYDTPTTSAILDEQCPRKETMSGAAEIGSVNVSKPDERNDESARSSSVEVNDHQVSESVSGDASICMVGLHCCGDLTPMMLKCFTELHCVQSLCCVSCCYHRMAYSETTKQFSNFPLSQLVQSAILNMSSRFPRWNFNPFSMRLAAQETRARWKGQIKDDHDLHERNVAFRALLQICLDEGEFELKKTSRRLASQSDHVTFDKYVEAVARHVQDCKPESTHNSFRSHMMFLYTEYQQYFSYIQPITALQFLLQPVLESLVHLDRQQWLLEQGYHSNIVPVFDEFVSPRNMMLVAIKRKT